MMGEWRYSWGTVNTYRAGLRDIRTLISA